MSAVKSILMRKRDSASGGTRVARPFWRLTLTTAIAATCLVASCVWSTEVFGAQTKVAHRRVLYGLTVDDISHISSAIAMERALPERPTTRVVFDLGEPASYYLGAVQQLRGLGAVMGELLDSSYEKAITAANYRNLVESYLSLLGSKVSIWEIGNEVNGNWTGPYSSVKEKLVVAYRAVAAARGVTALTLYANEYAPNNCGDGLRELTPVQFSQHYVPAFVRAGLQYVFESYYPTQCGNTFPSAARVMAEMEQLHRLYPRALLGFGEVGLPNAANGGSVNTARRVMSWAYGLRIPLSYYVGGYFWWYGAEDLVPSNKPLHSSFVAALRAESRALSV